MTTNAHTRQPDQSTPAQPLSPARKVSAVVIGLGRFVRPLWPVLREGLLTIAFAYGANQAGHNGSFLGMVALIAATGYQVRRMLLT